MSIKPLQSHCIDTLITVLESHHFHPKMINDICKWLPDHFLEPIFYYLVEKKVITDVTLIQFLIPSRRELRLIGVNNILNSTLKQIGYNCPHLVSFNIHMIRSKCIVKKK